MNTPKPAADIPPLIAWASRNSGIIFFILLFSVAMIEGVAIYASKRAAASSAAGVAPAGEFDAAVQKPR